MSEMGLGRVITRRRGLRRSAKGGCGVTQPFRACFSDLGLQATLVPRPAILQQRIFKLLHPAPDLAPLAPSDIDS
jgi:hypothetical protein